MTDITSVALTASNTSVTLENTAGSIELIGTFDSATVTQKITGGTTAIDTFTAAVAPFYTRANKLTFSIAGGSGSESVVIRWIGDVSRTTNG